MTTPPTTNWLADAADKARQEQGPVITGSMNRALPWACPLCTDKESKLIQIAGQQKIVCENNGEHQWKDTAEQNPMESVTALEQIAALNPKKLSTFKIPVKPQINREPMTFQIHKQLKADLQAKFGERLDPTLAAMAQLLLDPHAFVVDPDNAKRISELAGQNVRDGGTIYGVLFAQSKELQTFRDEEKERQRQRILRGEAAPASPTDIVLRLDPDTRERLLGRARDAEKPVEAYLADQMKFFLDNGWL